MIHTHVDDFYISCIFREHFLHVLREVGIQVMADHSFGPCIIREFACLEEVFCYMVLPSPPKKKASHVLIWPWATSPDGIRDIDHACLLHQRVLLLTLPGSVHVPEAKFRCKKTRHIIISEFYTSHWKWKLYSGPSLKGHSLEGTPLYKGHKFLAATTGYYECTWCSLSPKDTSLIRTELFGRRGVLITGGPMYSHQEGHRDPTPPLDPTRKLFCKNHGCSILTSASHQQLHISIPR